MMNPEMIALRNELNERTELLNKKIEAFEEGLKGMSFGVAVWIKVSPTVELGYERNDGQWRICVSERGNTAKPLLKASRFQRIQCYPRLPDLIPAIEKAAMEILGDIRKLT